YRHLNLAELEARLVHAIPLCRRAIIVTDGIFSMRGDHAPLDEIARLAQKYDSSFPENVIVVIDDSHGVGAFGATGRGTEERTGADADILVGTLGKAFGVNGGYIAGGRTVIAYLRETSPCYIYSNPIAPGEAAGAAGRELLGRLQSMAARFRAGLTDMGLETIAGDHPIVPLMLRDSARTAAI